MTQPAGSEIRVGTVLQDTYEVTSLLGRGGMGAVFLARHRRLPGRQVAVKVLQNSASLNPELYARFRREAEIASQLGHPNIVEVLDFDTLPDGTPFLLMEYLRGESLEQRLSRGPLPLPEAFSIVRQIGSALQAAHRAGVVHRDLKPANVFLVPTDAGGVVGERVKLLDFGISKMLDSQTLQTQEAVLMGTPQYMAPEQALGKNSEIDARTDLFALGCIVYEMLSGRPPFAGEGASIVQVIFRIVHTPHEPLSNVRPDLPAHVVAAVERALAKSPQDRFPDVGAFIAELTGSPLQTLSGAARAPVPASSEDGFAATHMPASTARFGAQAAPADDGLASTHMPASTARFPAPAQPVASDDVGFAATLVPANTARIPAPVEPAPAPAAPPPVQPSHMASPEPSRSNAKPPRIAVLGAIVAIVLGGVVARNWHSSQPAAHDASSVTGAPPTPSAPPPPEPPKAAVAAAPAAPPAAPVTPERKPSSYSAPHKAEVIPENVQKDLDDAEIALIKGDTDTAIRLAQRSQRDMKTVRSSLVLTRAYCMRKDLSNANAQWRNIPRGEGAQVRQFCKKYEIDL